MRNILKLYIFYQSLALISRDVFYFNLPRVNKILLGTDIDFQKQLSVVMNTQNKLGYFFYGIKYNSEKLYYLSNHIYYFHLKDNNPLYLPLAIYKARLKEPLYIQDLGTKSFYVTVVGQYSKNYIKDLAHISCLPEGSAIFFIGHDNNERSSLSIIYKQSILNHFKCDTDNIYIDYFYSIISNPFDNIMIIKYGKEVNIFYSLISDLKDNLHDIQSWKTLKVNQYNNFINSIINRGLKTNKIIEASKFFTQNLLNTTPVRNDCMKHYNQLLLYNFITSNDNIDSILEYSNDLDFTDTKAIIIAARAQNKSFLEHLLAKGINPNNPGYNGIIPLHFATKYNRYDNVKLLLEYNADLNIKNEQGNNALLIASSFKRFNIMSLLISEGADVTLKNNNQDDILSLAMTNDQLRVIENLLTNHLLTLIDKHECVLANKIASFVVDRGKDLIHSTHVANIINFFLRYIYNKLEMLDILDKLKIVCSEFDLPGLIKVENCIKQLSNIKCYDNFIALCSYEEYLGGRINDFVIYPTN